MKPEKTLAAPSRRQVLGGLALGTALGPAAHRDFDAYLRTSIQTVVVIYAENRSFNNLFGNFPGLKMPLARVATQSVRQKDRDGTVLPYLPDIWGGLVPRPQFIDGVRYQLPQDAITGLENAPFALRLPNGQHLPHAVVTRDLTHQFYHNQMQINGGRNDGFVAWGDSGALVMGHYANSSERLKLWRIARHYTLCDNFFMGAFGGSFLNHQYLIAAQPPYYPDAHQSPAAGLIAQIEGDDPAGVRLRTKPESPPRALEGAPLFDPSNLTPDFWAVNTMMPPFAPTAGEARLKLPPHEHRTIGDALTEGGIDWAWYAGAWKSALDGADETGPGFPPRPNFQVHHQPFNYFANFAPGTQARAAHLRDAGTGGDPQTNRFLAAAVAGTLPSVAFYKPEGDLNMHAGYSSVAAGDDHITTVIEVLQASPQWRHMAIIVTFDENGGWWDHVAPPKADRWGPGTRIPALFISPHGKKAHVDHTVYDTGSISRFIIRRFGLKTLDGLEMRTRAMFAASGMKPSDLTAALA